jgi:hypothetical protein
MREILRLTIKIVLTACWLTSAFGQRLSVGVIGGTNLTDDVRAGRQQSSGGLLPSGQMQTTTQVVEPGVRRPIIGIQIDYRVSRRWSLEFDALRRELKSTSTTLFSPPIEFPGGPTVSAFGPSTQLLTPWEFPLLAKYRFRPNQSVRPFLSGGASFRPAGTGTGLSHAGITVGGGFEVLTKGGFRITPTLRYTRWADKPVGFSIGKPLQNQVELLAGFDRPSPDATIGFFGQRLSIGVVTGIGLGKDFRVGITEQSQTPERNSPIVGIMVEAILPKNFAIEVDGLYRALHGTQAEFSRRVRFAHLTWEFPALVKYRAINRSRFTPFFEAGPSFRAEGNVNLRRVSHLGGTVGVGVETRLLRLRVAPRVRYTRWSGEADRVFSQAPLNQVHLLASFSF